jgi:hypothetical protein
MGSSCSRPPLDMAHVADHVRAGDVARKARALDEARRETLRQKKHVAAAAAEAARQREEETRRAAFEHAAARQLVTHLLDAVRNGKVCPGDVVIVPYIQNDAGHRFSLLSSTSVQLTTYQQPDEAFCKGLHRAMLTLALQMSTSELCWVPLRRCDWTAANVCHWLLHQYGMSFSLLPRSPELLGTLREHAADDRSAHMIPLQSKAKVVECPPLELAMGSCFFGSKRA